MRAYAYGLFVRVDQIKRREKKKENTLAPSWVYKPILYTLEENGR